MLQNKVTSPTCSKFSSSDANLRSNSESIYQTNNGFESILNRSISMPSSDSLVGSPAEQNVFHLTSQLSSMVQCSTALSNLPRFPHPLAIHDDEIGLSLASSRIVSKRLFFRLLYFCLPKCFHITVTAIKSMTL